MPPSRLILWAVLILGTPSPWVTDVGAQDVPPPEQQAQFLVRAFGFDRALVDRGALRIAVLYVEEPAEAEPMRSALEAVGSPGVQGLPVTAVAVRFESVATLLEGFEEEGVTAVYIPGTLAPALSSIQQVTRARGLVSLSGGRRLGEQGVAMGVYMSGSGPRLIVNLRSLQIEGADISAEVLGISEIVR